MVTLLTMELRYQNKGYVHLTLFEVVVYCYFCVGCAYHIIFCCCPTYNFYSFYCCCWQCLPFFLLALWFAEERNSGNLEFDFDVSKVWQKNLFTNESNSGSPEQFAFGGVHLHLTLVIWFMLANFLLIRFRKKDSLRPLN